MAAPRLLFLWPMLLRSAEASPSLRASRPSISKLRERGTRAAHSTSRQRQQNRIPQRYGSANEPLPHLGGATTSEGSVVVDMQEQTKLPKIGEKLQKDGEETLNISREDKLSAASKKESSTVDGRVDTLIRSDPMLDASESQPVKDPPDGLKTPVEKPMETLLESVPDPAQKQREDQEAAKQDGTAEDHPAVSFDEHAPPIRAPHLDPPRHVHHFDTYSLVRRLVEGGWNEKQAVTTMKAVRLMLTSNMDLAKEALVSKSNVENETYLFRAACAELKTEVTSRRKAEQEKMRTERTQLQHEVDILGQRMSQEVGMLKDDLKGMFDDRKMSVRNEQRGMEGKVSQLNYKITVDLQADAKSEVEGLRWVMTRRVIIALFVVVMMVVGSLKLLSNAVHEQELEAKRRKNMKSGATQTEADDLPISNTLRREPDLNPNEMLVKEGDNPGFVSLG
ncbi:Hypothetical protein R9X50_00381200 [Acrodontium crateriforme]|uniref:Uncharacterized protein n=1 Tax=Acrodontium crateriforme TaxID=150365 RepID=A0AAQ3M4A2_9PEZI|nr:Hypothetical protein R9X50_00381200 [Acrodontium crateriforme]